MHQTRWHFSSLLSSCGEQTVALFYYTQCTVVFCCCGPSEFRDALLNRLVVMSGYVSCCYLPISLEQFACATSKRHFHPENCSSLDIYSFSKKFSLNLRSVVFHQPCFGQSNLNHLFSQFSLNGSRSVWLSLHLYMHYSTVI